jgi:hypothetical protein
VNTPSTIPAIRPSYTRKLLPRSEAFLHCLKAIALYEPIEELDLLIRFRDTNPFPEGEPGMGDYYRAFQDWKKGRWRP